MACILNLETSTKNCSVSISRGGKLISLVELASEHYSHGEQLHPFIVQAVEKAGIALGDLMAVAVGKGPGSYTGLRIGVSAAKGLCFAQEIPLIACNSLEILAKTIQRDNGLIIPMIDARRMEVYSAVYNAKHQIVREIQAQIIEEDSFIEERQKGPLIFVGDGAAKCKEVLRGDEFEFVSVFPSAKELAKLSFEKYQKSDFEEVAYFEPYYLKDFVVTPQKSRL